MGTRTTTPTTSIIKPKGKSLWIEGYHRLLKNKASVVSMVFIVLVCLMAIFAEELSPYPFDEPHVDDALVPPNSTYWLGTDSLGRDMLSRIIYGAKMSMSVAIYTSIISLLIGGIYGAVSGYVGGKLDSIMMRFVDILYAIPTLVLLILVKVFFDAVEIFDDPELKALVGILAALSVVGWVMLARVVRGQVLQVKQMAYVEASHALGARGIWIVVKHIFPNILGPIVVLLSYQIPSNILFESFLSFIGLGLQPPYSSWGVLASDGWRSLRSFPHLILYPSLILFLVILAFNLFGDGLRDAFDPKMRGKQ
ncbi:MAG: peptide ABC transporter permease [Bdellovibrionaceae bacterium]|nr:peptide ABC transporter permease [Pseudobdellovibrionaceae bacterium]|tara:strand:+ start:185312 stop:186238 length:927 start_codon:yes stop_codon:yes gene_type:complete